MPVGESPEPIQRIGWIALCALLFVTAVAARSIPHLDRRDPTGLVRVEDPDACYHLRRAERLLAGAPRLAVHDPWLAPPRGAAVIWPPLWDLVLAAATAMAPGDAPTGRIHAAVAFLPPIAMGLAAIAVAGFARRLGESSFTPALVAGLFVALSAADRPWTGFGQIDHTAIELLSWALLALALARALAQGEAFEPRSAIVPGAALALGIGVQAAFVLAAALAPLALLILTAAPVAAGRASNRQERAVSALLFLGVHWGFAALLLVPFAGVYAAAGSPIAHDHFGPFQPLLLGLAAATAGGAGLALGRAPQGTFHLSRYAGAGLALIALAGAIAIAPELRAGFSFLRRGPDWIASIGESRSPFGQGFVSGLGEWLRSYSWLALAAPFGAARLRSALRPSGPASGVPAVALSWLLIGTALAALQARFSGHLLLPLGLTVGALAGLLSRRLESGRPARRWLVSVAVGVAFLCAFGFPALAAKRPPERAARALAESWDVLQDLRRRDAGNSAPPAVVAEWSFGHFIAWYGRHPAAVDNFGDVVGELARPRDVLLETDEALAVAAMDRYGARYLLVGELAETFSGLLASPAQARDFVSSTRPGGAGTVAVEFRPPIVRTVLYRAARQLGSAVQSPTEGFVPPLGQLRLVAESAATEVVAPGREIARFKLYERVAGARLRLVGAPPRVPAVFDAEVETPRGRRFPYLALVETDAAGTAELRFPYASVSASGGRVRGARWMAEGAARPVLEVSERSVVEGAPVEVRW